MRDRSQNRKPLQRGRNLSIEAIQAVQALKRAKRDDSSLERVFESKVRRLLKLDMIAVLKQLLNQNECLLALKVHLLLSYLKKETGLELETEGFNALLRTLIDFDMTGPAMECFQLMKTSGCEPNKSSFRILIKGLESKGELDISATVKLDAQKYFGESLEFLEEEEDMTVGFNYN
ncbi:Protein thylakoid assembly 8, chloroplastic [Vitis vinifera]|uniref:Protein thylakoid assembly 8, chloroplastic n=1 Tax=Vitis vinifera TaxID=29760 RepID=A0A438EKK6_VITVI|nr:Protein thylakoid assembly 8, chloroplastic [Vitis vinifera]